MAVACDARNVRHAVRACGSVQGLSSSGAILEPRAGSARPEQATAGRRAAS